MWIFTPHKKFWRVGETFQHPMHKYQPEIKRYGSGVLLSFPLKIKNLIIKVLNSFTAFVCNRVFLNPRRDAKQFHFWCGSGLKSIKTQKKFFQVYLWLLKVLKVQFLIKMHLKNLKRFPSYKILTLSLIKV